MNKRKKLDTTSLVEQLVSNEPLAPESESTDIQPRAKSGKHHGRLLKNAREIPLDKIQPDPNQPRSQFDQDALEELAQSIRKHGVRQPIEVEYNPAEDYFQIVSGERRYRASQLAGLDHIPCVIQEVADKDRLAIQLVENIQREDLSPIDKARGLLEYKKSLGKGAQWKHVEEITGISERRRQQFLALLDLPEDIQNEIVSLGNDRTTKNVITEGHARALLKLKKYPDKQKELFEQIKNGTKPLTSKEAMTAAREMIEPAKKPVEKITFAYTSIPDLITQLEKKLAELQQQNK